jgi:repressor LexA
MLTNRQQQILDFIREHQRVRGVTPSTREIQEHLGLASQTTVVDHLKALENKGVLKKLSNTARGLVLTERYAGSEMREIPIYGTIPAGFPADQQQEAEGCIAVDTSTLRLPKGARTFGLKVRGDSMINAGILNGDVVILEFREPRNNDIVAALIDGDCTLKRYLIQRGKPFLKAENPKYPNLIPARELVIQGVQIALLRLS